MKYFFSDVDGTLLQDHKLEESTIAEVKKFIEKGNKFFLSTGRVDADIKKIENYMGIVCDFRISQNGAVIKDKNDNIIYQKLLPKEVLKDLSDYIYSLNNTTIEISEADNRYSTTDRKIKYNYEFTAPIIIDPDLKEKIPSLQCTLFLILSDDESQFPIISQYVKNEFGDKVYAVQTSPGCLEIISNDVSKGNAIKYLQNVLQIKDEDIIVAGDSYNDISMFTRYKDNSFVMANANPNVKDYAKFEKNNVAEVIRFLENKI